MVTFYADDLSKPERNPKAGFVASIFMGLIHKYFQLALRARTCFIAIKLFLRLNPSNPPNEQTYVAALSNANAFVNKLKTVSPVAYSRFQGLLIDFAAADLILTATQPGGFNLADHWAFVACALEHQATSTLRLTVRLLRWLYPRMIQRNPNNNAQICLNYLQSLPLPHQPPPPAPDGTHG
jgi:hypothetical protein